MNQAVDSLFTIVSFFGMLIVLVGVSIAIGLAKIADALNCIHNMMRPRKHHSEPELYEPWEEDPDS